MKKRYRILDLYCCAGGCAKGYHDAGFEVVGVDIVDRPNYPYDFINGDALEVLKDVDFITSFDAIHASPPCQYYSKLKYLSGDVQRWEEEHVDLVAPTRELLEYYWKTYKIPYVIENVQNAPLINPITLYGSQFEGLFTQRPRLFESCIKLNEPTTPKRNLKTGPLGTVTEDGIVSVCGQRNLKGLNDVQTKLYYGIALGGIDWMSKEELTQAIPPAYTKFIGKQLIEYLEDAKDDNKFDLDELVNLVTKMLMKRN